MGMTIKYGVGGSGAGTALDATGLLPLYTGFKASFHQSPQIENLYGSLNPLVRDNGNGSWTVSWTCYTTHASEAAALEYISTQALALQGQKDLSFTIGGTTLTLTQCVLTAFDPDEQNGISNTIRYQFVGQSIS